MQKEQKNGDLNNIYIYRSTFDKDRTTNRNNQTSLNDLLNLDNVNNLKLKEDDLIVVREKLGFQEKEFVTVEGLVKYPGTYAIKNNNFSFFDLIQDFDGFLNDAALDGIKIIRENKLIEEENSSFLDLSDTESLKVQVEIIGFFVFGVVVKIFLATNESNLKYNVILKPFDRIIVPRKDNSIEITGAVQQSSRLSLTH